MYLLKFLNFSMVSRYSPPLVTFALSAILGSCKTTTGSLRRHSCLLINPLIRHTNQTCWIGTQFLSTMKAKTVLKAVLSVEQDEGVGARVRRSVGRPEVRHILQDIVNYLRDEWKT